MNVPRPLVLAVADDGDLRDLLRDGLGERGHDVVIVPNSERAAAMARARRPDVVVLDLDPRAVPTDWAMKELLAAAPVVILAAPVDHRVATGLIGGSAFDVVMKPFSLARLDTALRAAIAHGRRGSS